MEFRGLDESNWLAVCSCGHLEDYDPAAVASRRHYLEAGAESGLRLIVAHLRGRPAGFAELVPIETAARDISGEGALFLHCVLVLDERRGVGRALVEEAARVAAIAGRGLVVDALHDVYGFMPMEFFTRLGFRVLALRGSRRLMYRPCAPWAETATPLRAGTRGAATQPSPAHYLTPRYTFKPAPGRAVTIDVFFTPLCGGLVSEEAVMMRKAASDYPGLVEVREYNCGDPEVRRRYGIARAVFVNGVMRPNGDVIGIDEARGLLRKAVIAAAAGRPPSAPDWDDTISRLF
jgi:GNAT superfamily N-acetyltransferase